MPRPDRPGVLYLSPSSLTTLAGCESRFVREREPGLAVPDAAPGRALLLGSLLGEYQEEYYLGGDWRALWHEQLHAEGWDPDEWEPPDPYPTAHYLMARYEEWAPEHLPLVMHATEVPFDQRLATKVHLRGYLDGLADWEGDEEHEAGLYVVEFKSSGKMDRFYGLQREVQPWIYADAMRRQGSPVKGVIYPYTLTTHYKTEQPAYKNFRYKVIPWDERAAKHYRGIAKELAQRARHLLDGSVPPVRNIAHACSWCPFQRPCLRPWEVE